MVSNRLIAIIAVAAAMLFLLASCKRGGASGVQKNNVMPLGIYAGEAGTLTFDTDSHVAPSSDHGYVLIELASEYIYMLNGEENNKEYEFQLDEWDNDSDKWRWHIYSFSESAEIEDIREIYLVNFVWNRADWNTGEDKVIIQDEDGDLVFKFSESN